MSFGIGADLHDKAYMEVLLHILNSKEGKEAFLCESCILLACLSQWSIPAS